MKGINLANALLNAPKGLDDGLKLYSPYCGECILKWVDVVNCNEMSVITENGDVIITDGDGRLAETDCIIFPSEDQNWNILAPIFSQTCCLGKVVVIDGEFYMVDGKGLVDIRGVHWKYTDVMFDVTFRFASEKESTNFGYQLKHYGYQFDPQKMEVGRIFNEGDWIVTTDGLCVASGIPSKLYIDTITWSGDLKCKYIDCFGEVQYWTVCCPSDIDKYRLWTVDDIKNGDILEYSGTGITFVADKVCKDFITALVYYSKHMTEINGFQVFDIPVSFSRDNVKPVGINDYLEFCNNTLKSYGYGWDYSKRTLLKLQEETKQEETKQKTPQLRPYDKIIVGTHVGWAATFFSHFINGNIITTDGRTRSECIIYNDETKHLLGKYGDYTGKYVVRYKMDD